MIVKAVSDTTGSFRLDNLPPGRYVLAASGPSRPPARSDNVDLDAGRTVTTKITVPLGAKLSGRVMDGETHKPIAGASVVLDATAASGVSAIPPANTDANGQYALEGVPPTGPFSIRVEHDSYRTKIVPGLTARGATMTQDVELSKAGDGGRDTEMPGIGAVLIARGKNIIIQTIVPGAPGEKAGLEEGDVITRVDGQSTDGWTVSDAIQHLRGPEKTRVSVQVNRKGQPVEVVVTRANFVR
jgi:membrane-associated protease RseP (regulator of RpoE activity)